MQYRTLHLITLATFVLYFFTLPVSDIAFASDEMKADGAFETSFAQKQNRRIFHPHLGPLEFGDQFHGGTFDLPPPKEQKPYPVGTILLQERTPSSITLRWRDRSTVEDETLLRRRRDGGNGWEDVFTYGPVSNYHTIIDVGLDSDQRYCYQFVTSNDFGSSFSHQICAYTQGTQSGPVVRAQLRIKTGDVEHAGTDDQVFVRLNSPSNASTYPALNETMINYGRNDFERDDEFTYDLELSFLERPSDVTLLSIGKEGSDGLCIDEVELIINTSSVFEKIFGNDTCQWIDSDNGHSNLFTFFHEELRSHPSWNEPPIPFQLVIPRQEIESRIQSAVGHMIARIDEVEWDDLIGDNWVEASRYGDGTLRIDLDLEAIVPASPNPSIDVDFTTNVGFVQREGAWVFEMLTSDLESSTDYNWFIDTLGFLLPCGPIASLVTGEGIPDCVSAFERYIDEQVISSWPPIASSYLVNNPCPGRPTITVTEDAAIQFGCGETDSFVTTTVRVKGSTILEETSH